MSSGAVLADTTDGPGSARALVQAARGGQLAVRLFPGDPLLNGAVADAAACAKAGVRFEIVPGVPAATAVPAYAGIPLASERNGECASSVPPRRARSRGQPGRLVVLGADAAPADLGKMRIAAGWPEGTRLAITWDGTTSAQQTVVSSLGRIGPDLKAAGVSLANTRGSAIAVVGDAVAARDQLSWFETKPLFGWRVLVPRTKEQAAVVSQRLREYGAVPEEVPTIAVEPPRTPQQMERAVKGLVTGRYQWVAFTSANAVRAVRERFEEYGLDARAFAGVKVAAVGEQTSAALLDFGIRRTWCPTATSRPRASPRPGRRTTTCSTRSTGCCCRARTSPPRPCWRG
jgi:uroporphyrinogen III methyltransferase/synthase